MKRQYMLFVIVLLFCTNTSAQQKEYSGKIHVTTLSLQQEGDSVYVKLSFDISGVNVDSRRSISLVPALVAAGDRLDLPEVVVKGRENYNEQPGKSGVCRRSSVCSRPRIQIGERKNNCIQRSREIQSVDGGRKAGYV